MIHYAPIGMFFVAFLLLLLVSVSLPVTKTIKYFTLSLDMTSGTFATGVKGSVSFGNYGYCYSDIIVKVVGITNTVPGECSKVKLGFKFDQRLVDLLRLQDLQDAINGGLTFALVVNPIACGFTFLTLIFAIWFAFRHKHGLAPLILGAISGLIAAILATIAFVVNYVIMSVTKKNVEKIQRQPAPQLWSNDLDDPCRHDIALDWVGPLLYRWLPCSTHKAQGNLLNGHFMITRIKDPWTL
ncbi:SubName: Full=Uncharacterized protein {ECO:0000313/EMBL:CCA69234.1} [Serendipita indica DSM 11827]|nr:SubName: Full=Uncharacterized protein {ECO:0000313/EMBL:CCA69234.1} [Serendipita indica DSM 11827]